MNESLKSPPQGTSSTELSQTDEQRPLDERPALEATHADHENRKPKSRKPFKSWYELAVIGLYALLVLSGITTSSISTELLRESPEVASGTLLFDAQPIRSDEFLTYTPILLGYINSSGERSVSPLGQEPDLIYQLPSGGAFFESVIFFDGLVMRLGNFVPHEMLFAAYWWFPALLLALALPPLLRRFGANASLSYLATALFFFAPSVAWWSNMPIRLTAFGAAGAMLLIKSSEKLVAGRRLVGVGFALLAGILWARIPTNYVPWSAMLAAPVALAAIAWLWSDKKNRKTNLIASVIAGVTALGLFAMLLVENLSSLKSEFSTVYPGSRLSSGELLSLDKIFGAPLLYNIGDYTPIGSNPSEMSSAFTVCAIWAFVVWLGHRHWSWNRTGWPLAVFAGFTSIWLAWIMINWGGLGQSVPVLNRVPPYRAAQVVGLLAVLVLALVLSRAGNRTQARVWLTAGVATAAVTAMGGATLIALRGAPTAPRTVALVAVGLGVLVAALTARPKSRIAALAVGIAALLNVVSVNPIQQGLADLSESKLARFVASHASEGGYWVSDSLGTNALLISSGVPTLTGHQVTGPNRAQWQKLDPQGKYTEVWNRGASLILAQWSHSQEPVISLRPDQPDMIMIDISPCRLPAYGFEVTHVLAGAPLSQPCLKLDGVFEFGGGKTYVYNITEATG